ncbi:hypothetical protein [Elizabethkingia anophelis]|nr:hypothetical protein [Elizabethkingia anophelis]HAY3534680.1 hypothetical protein [Elizabethkingia anophelis]HAY3546796.1 hypothetical protein [Elizabethkingia anophelis]
MSKIKSKGEKLNWKPLRSVEPIKISAKNLKGRTVIVKTDAPKRMIID